MDQNQVGPAGEPTLWSNRLEDTGILSGQIHETYQIYQIFIIQWGVLFRGKSPGSVRIGGGRARARRSPDAPRFTNRLPK